MGVCGVSSPQAKIAAALRRPFTTSTRRKLQRRSTAVVIGFIAKLPAKTASTSSPDFERAEGEGDLEQQGQQERHGGDRDAKQRSAVDRDGVAANFERAEIKQRIRTPFGVRRGHKAERKAGRDAGAADPWRPAVLAQEPDAVDDQEAGDAGQRKTRPVELRRLALGVRDQAEGQRQRNEPQRHVEVKYPRPGRVGRYEAADAAAPALGAARPGQVMIAIAFSRSCFSVVRKTASRPTGTIIAPPAPCRMRASTKVSRLWQ